MKLKYRIINLLLALAIIFGSTNVVRAAKFELNVAIVGDPGVGKTTLLNKFCDLGKNVQNQLEHTYMDYVFEKNDYVINFYDIDMPLETMEASPDGHEYADLLAKCHNALVVFDLSEGDTLGKGRIQRWQKMIKHRNYLCDICFVPNKIDLISSEQEKLKLGMPIAKYTGDSERKQIAKYPGIPQEFSCITSSAVSGNSHKEIINIICGYGCQRIWAFEKFLGIKTSRVVKVEEDVTFDEPETKVVAEETHKKFNTLEDITRDTAEEILNSRELLNAMVKIVEKWQQKRKCSFGQLKSLIVQRLGPDVSRFRGQEVWWF